MSWQALHFRKVRYRFHGRRSAFARSAACFVAGAARLQGQAHISWQQAMCRIRGSRSTFRSVEPRFYTRRRLTPLVENDVVGLALFLDIGLIAKQMAEGHLGKKRENPVCACPPQMTVKIPHSSLLQRFAAVLSVAVSQRKRLDCVCTCDHFMLCICAGVCVCGVRVRVCVCVFALARRRVCLRVSVYVCVFAWLCVLKLERTRLRGSRWFQPAGVLS